MNIDLNADVAEGCGQDDKLLTIVSSANVCCGLHAGSYAEMIATLQLAKKNNVRVGAHPGLDDRENFGRTNQSLGEEVYRALMAYQLGATKALCNLVGVSLDYVKPHGALYNQAAVDESLADILVSEIKRFDPNLKVMGLSGGHLVAAAKRQGLVSISEVFADRSYEKDGSLVSRSKDNALITDTQAAIDHVLQMITQGTVTSICGEVVPVEAESICLHGDGAHAILFAREIKKQLEQKGITISAQ
ncbi:5-oxoprolinase subunit PxpA [Psychrobacter pacificensis]|uniref:5-oxoprolinase subunit PxpA n=1 Tax=Psychrobacter pacificensis TaxID=112002 RepID=UPI001CDE3F62|nr:5-oxoprolinase subunit PxpA [Psychrobacter pacificensis]MBZ1391458.1 5-oxoprolinase subunit PxpA [Psychrobacter pacificensis]MDE0843539.1 5-oxoprolinase subunit PxpA [Psychrobacter pacificensis]